MLERAELIGEDAWIGSRFYAGPENHPEGATAQRPCQTFPVEDPADGTILAGGGLWSTRGRRSHRRSQRRLPGMA